MKSFLNSCSKKGWSLSGFTGWPVLPTTFILMCTRTQVRQGPGRLSLSWLKKIESSFWGEIFLKSSSLITLSKGWTTQIKMHSWDKWKMICSRTWKSQRRKLMELAIRLIRPKTFMASICSRRKTNPIRATIRISSMASTILLFHCNIQSRKVISKPKGGLWPLSRLHPQTTGNLSKNKSTSR